MLSVLLNATFGALDFTWIYARTKGIILCFYKQYISKKKNIKKMCLEVFLFDIQSHCKIEIVILWPFFYNKRLRVV